MRRQRALPARSPAVDGFTLIELLAALSVLALLASLAAGALRLGGRIWDRTSSDLEALDEAFAAQDLLRRLLTRVYPAPVGEPGSIHVAFDGTADAIAFRAASPLPSATDGYVPMALLVDREGGRFRLVLSVSDGGRDRRLVLLDRLSGATFDYYRSPRHDEIGMPRSGEWRARWQAEQWLPGLIRLSVSFPPGDPRWWPDLIVAPKVDVDALCRPDPLSHGCEGR